MHVLYDANNIPLVYWPISINAGQDSPVLVIRADAFVGAVLLAKAGPQADVYGRIQGVGSYQNLATTPLAFGHLLGRVSFEIYVHGHSDVSPSARVPLSVGIPSQAIAGWTL